MKRLLLVSLAIVLVFGLILAGCASSTPAPTTSAPNTSAPITSTAPVTTSKPAPSTSQPATTAAPAGPSEIILGASAPLTGNLAGFGQGSGWALQAAVEDLNKQGGIMVKDYNRKLPLRLVLLDNQSDPAKASTLAESLILQDKVNFLVSGTRVSPGICYDQRDSR